MGRGGWDAPALSCRCGDGLRHRVLGHSSSISSAAGACGGVARVHRRRSLPLPSFLVLFVAVTAPVIIPIPVALRGRLLAPAIHPTSSGSQGWRRVLGRSSSLGIGGGSVVHCHRRCQRRAFVVRGGGGGGRSWGG